MPEEVFRLLLSSPSRTVPGIAMYGTPFYVWQHNSADHKLILTRVFIYDPAAKTTDSRSTFRRLALRVTSYEGTKLLENLLIPCIFLYGNTTVQITN